MDDTACEILAYLPNVNVRVLGLGGLSCGEDTLLPATLDSIRRGGLSCGEDTLLPATLDFLVD